MAVQKRGPTWTVHRIEDGSGRINLDYFSVNITDLPKLDGRRLEAAELLRHLRLNINDFVDQDNTSFEPYKSEDVEKWKAEDPSGALVLINIKLVPGVTDLALVATTMNASNEWIFSTVRGGSGFKALNNRDNPGAHPVSGNRAFGFKKIGSGWTFYTRGADRATRPMDEFWGVRGASDIGFEQAEKLWHSFQQKLTKFVNDHGGKAEVATPSDFSKRFDWDDQDLRKKVYDPSGQPAWVSVPKVR